MHVRVSHQTTYEYDAPVHALIQVLRLTPRDHENQFVRHWQIDLNVDAAMKAREDAFGNITHTLYFPGPLTAITISVDGEVETQDSQGVILGAREPFPPRMYLRETDLTHPSAGMTAFARDVVRGTDGLARLHALLTAIHCQIRFDTEITHATTTASEAFAIRSGVCQDISHIFIGCARHMGIPARYVGGYLLRTDGANSQVAGHAWSEAYVPDLGWVGFDAANGICTTEAHVRVSVGLDYLGAAPVRGARAGHASEKLSVAVVVDDARAQQQS